MDIKENNLWKRIALMVRGLAKPRATREYKEARIELQRMSAPLTAVLLPALALAVAFVLCATGRDESKVVRIELAPQDDEVIEEIPPEEVPPPEATPDVSEPDVSIDVPVPDEMEVAKADVPASDAKPVDAVSLTKSPITSIHVRGVKFAGGGGSPFGSQLGVGKGGKGRPDGRGAMVGEIVDLKRDKNGNEIGVGNYWAKCRAMVDGRFSPESSADAFRLSKRVALTYLYIPKQDANNGPEAFGVADEMKPSGWAIHYACTLKPDRKMRLRFIGQFDDMIVVCVNGKVVMEATWGSDGTKPGQVTGWRTTATDVTGKWKGPDPNTPLVVGDWVEFDPKGTYELDLLVGERPGGLISGVLLCEEEGVNYEKDASGRPKWPIFATRALSIQDIDRLEAASTAQYPYAFGTEPPAFNHHRTEIAKILTANDVPVSIDL